MGNDNDKRENILPVHSVLLSKMKDITSCICSIQKLHRFNKGFFCKIPFPDNLHNITVIIIYNRDLTEEDLMPGKNLSLTFEDNSKNIYIYIGIPIEKFFLARNIIFQLLK